MIVPGQVWRIRMCWRLFGQEWSNVVYVAHVSGSSPDLAKSAQRGLWFNSLWQSKIVELLPSSVSWFQNLVERVAPTYRRLGAFPVARVGAILTEQALAPNHAIPFTCHGAEDDPPGSRAFYLSGISEGIPRGQLLNEFVETEVNEVVSSFAVPYTIDGATFRQAVRLQDGNYHFVDVVRYSPRLAILSRRTRKLCRAHEAIAL